MNNTKSAIKLMRLVLRFAVLLLLAAVVTVGCKKQQAPPGSSVDILDASKFRPAFASAPADQQAAVDSVMMSIQGSNFPKARAELDRLSKMAGVTEQQQAVVKDLGDQLDKKIAAMANAAAPK
jgi:PBP1b-binding outer membrane lipoprotein LpoB